MLAPGQTVDRYELVCSIGDGGMAHVWAARQRGKHGFEKLFALKVIHSRFAEDENFRKMFLDEARIVANITHRNVAQVFDLGEERGLLYLAMEYVDGDSLFALIAPTKTVPVPIALRITADTCAGLHAVHQLADASGRPRNVVHRDISPQNILLSSGGDVKLIDFGIAHARDRITEQTAMGTVKGKVRYMAPEQVRKEPLGPYTDVFAAGAVLFRLLTGRAPYAAATDVATMQALLALSPPLASLPNDVPQSVAAIIYRAIAPEVKNRYANAKEMQDAIEAVLAREGVKPDVVEWTNANLSDRARQRRITLAESASGDLKLEVPDLGAPTARAPAAIVATTEPLYPPIRPKPPDPDPQYTGKERSFMDVGAIVQRGAQPPAPAPSKVVPGTPTTSTGGLAFETEHSAVIPNVPQIVPVRAPPPSAGARGGAIFKGAIAAIVIVLLVLGVLFLLPMIARDRAINAAREAGIELTIDRVGVSFGGVSLRGVNAKAIHIPGATATIQEIYLSGVTGKDVRITGLDAKLVGTKKDLEVPLGLLANDQRQHFSGQPGSPRHLSIAGARMTWEGISGEGTRLQAGDMGIELDSKAPGTEEYRGSVGRFDLKTQTTTFGPWAASFESAATSSRVRVMFDPPVPDGPSALYVVRKGVPPELTIRIPRSPFANLGLKPKDIGLPADDKTEVEMKIEGKLPLAGQTGHSELKAEISVYGVKADLLRTSIDVHINATATGAAGKPLDFEKTTVTLGPFLAAVTGTLTPHEDGLGVRLDAMFKTVPLPCAQLAQAEAKKAGPLAATLQALGQTTGALKFTGTVNASGVVKYDTSAPEEASVAWLAKETCGISIFGQ